MLNYPTIKFNYTSRFSGNVIRAELGVAVHLDFFKLLDGEGIPHIGEEQFRKLAKCSPHVFQKKQHIHKLDSATKRNAFKQEDK